MEDILLYFVILLCLTTTFPVFSHPFDYSLGTNPSIWLTSGSYMEPQENCENMNCNREKVTPENVADTERRKEYFSIIKILKKSQIPTLPSIF